MTNETQGAVGAETMTAGQSLERLYDFACTHPRAHNEQAKEIDTAYAQVKSALSTPAPRTDGGMTAGVLWSAWPEDDCDSDPRIDPMAQKVTEWFVGRWPVGAEEPECRILIGEGRSAEIVARRLAEKLTSILNTDAIRARNAATPAQPAGAVPDGLRALSEAATQGEWYAESEKCDGSYGSGEDCGEGYLAYSILTDAEPRHGNPGVIAETSNSTLGVIHEESDEDGFTAWDETARTNTAFIVAAVNFVRTLLASHPAGQSAGSGAEDGDKSLVDLAAHHGRDWAVWWQGSGPERGDHIMELRQGNLDYARELAWIGDQHHGQAGALVAEHNEQMRRLREVIGRQRVAKELLQKEVAELRMSVPDSTRTGQGEKDGLLFRLRTAFDSDSIPEKNIALRRAYDALAARPAAPEAQGAWSFDMEAAPRDGTPVDLWCHGRRYIDYRWDTEGRAGGWWSDARHKDRHWRDRECLMPSSVSAWRIADAPPASSGQGGR